MPRDEGDGAPAADGRGRQREAHAPARAVAEEADGVQRLAGPRGGDGEATADEVLVDRADRLAERADERLRLDDATGALVAAHELAAGGADHAHAVGPQRRDVALRRRVGPHLPVHRRGDDDGAGRGEVAGGQQVVGEPLGEPGQRVGGRRVDPEHVRPARERDVGLGVDALPHLGADGVAGDPLEGRRTDHRQGAPGRDDVDVRAGAHEQARDEHRLVRGDATGHAQQDTASCQARLGLVVQTSYSPGV